MLRRVITAVCAGAMTFGAVAVTASPSLGAEGPLPKAANGKPVQVLATGLGVRTPASRTRRT